MNRRTFPFDPWLPALTLALVGAGVAMIYSASAPRALSAYGSSWHFAARQAAWAGLGFLVLAVGARVDYTRWGRAAGPLLVLTCLLLGAVLVPGVGVVVNGARRWLPIGPFALQPSELAKFVAVVYMAGYAARHGGALQAGGPAAVIRPMLVVGTLLGLIVVEPDLGNAVAIGAVSGVLLFVGGICWRYIVPLVGLAGAGLALAVYLEPYRLDRVRSFLDPWSDASDTGFQVVQSFLAFGSGGVTGLGLGEGRQKLFFLPEPHTDFIYAVIGEELGLLGAVLVLGLFAVFAWRGLTIARHAGEPFGRFLALGLTLMVVIQALVNMGVAVGVLPNKGLPLPFVSYGGSSLLVNLLAVGVLVNISKARPGRW
jgi:cell division protein FtsW